jgi:hypothetical protein
MSLFIYTGTVTEISVVKSARLKAGLCHSLGQDVQPLQLRVLLTHFTDLETPERVLDCIEVDDDGTTYNSLLAEYICGCRLEDGSTMSYPKLPDSKVLQLITQIGSLVVNFDSQVELEFLVNNLELTPKYRKVDGLHMRSAPPNWENSRKIWRLSNATLCRLNYVPIAVQDSVPVASTPLTQKPPTPSESPCS